MAKKILIIDDDPIIVKYLKNIFTDNGYETCTAASGVEASDVVRNEKPDLITLDLEMPEQWGPRFYRKLSKNKELKDIPGITLVDIPSISRSNYYKYVAILDEGIDRVELKKAMKEKYEVGLSGEVYELPCHLQPIFKDMFDYKGGEFPVAEELCRRQICLEWY